MPLVKKLVDFEFIQGLDTNAERKRTPMGKLLDLENAVFTSTVPELRAGSSVKGDAADGDTLSEALAVESVGGELLRWTDGGVYATTATAATWQRRGDEDVARPLLASLEQMVSGAQSAEAHDCLSLGGIDVVAWTESGATATQRKLKCNVRDRASGVVWQQATVLATDTNGADFWRLQPRLAQVDATTILLVYVIDTELFGRVLLTTTPTIWGAETTLAEGISDRVGPRFPWELDAVGSSSGAVVAWTGATQGSAVVTSSSSTGGNPAPALLVDPTSVYAGTITFAVTSGTTIAVSRDSVTNAAATLPTAARSVFGFTGYVQAKVTAAPAIVVARTAGTAPPSGSPAPAVSFLAHAFTGTLDVGVLHPPQEQNSTNYNTWANIRFDSPGYINSFGTGGGLVRVRVTTRYPASFEDNIPRSATVVVTGPNGYSQTIATMYEPDPDLGGALDWHALPELGYSIALPTLSTVLATTGQYWEWRFYPQVAKFSINEGSYFSARPNGEVYFMFGREDPPVVLPLAISLDVYNASGALIQIRVLFAFTDVEDTTLYTSTDVWRATITSGTVAYAANGGSYGGSQALYTPGTGVAYAHTIASGLTLTWATQLPTKLTTNDVFRVTVAPGTFTYQLGAGAASSPLAIYDGSGQPLTYALLSSGSPIAIDVKWPVNVGHSSGETWVFTVSIEGRVVRALLRRSGTIPQIVAGPYDLNVNPLDGLTLGKHGGEDLDVTLIFRDRTLSEVQAYVFTDVLTQVSDALVLATSGTSSAADGLLHVASYLDDTGVVVAILESTSQAPLEIVSFTQSGLEGSLAKWVRGVRLLSRPFLVGLRWCIATIYMPAYGGGGGTTVGFQPTLFVVNVDTQKVVARLLAGNAGALVSSGLPKTLATDAPGAARILVPRRTRLQLEAGATQLVDVSVTGIVAITLSEASPASIGRVEDEGGLHVGGALPRYYDGAGFTENGFNVYPEGASVTFTSGGSLAAGSYSWVFVYEWTDSRGRRHLSAPSVPLLGTTTSTQKAQLVVPLLHLTEKSEVRIAIYRTEANGQTHYRTVNTVFTYVQVDPATQTVDTVTILDGASDSSLTDNEVLYTDGNELEHQPPPAYSTIAKHQQYFFTNLMEDAGGVAYSLPARISESSVWNDALAYRVTGTVAGFATLDDKLLTFTATNALVVTGTGPDLTGASNGFQVPQVVTGSVGCSNASSILATPLGVLHSSGAGLYLLARELMDVPLGDAVKRYSGLTVTRGLLLPTVRQARLYTAEGTTLVFDYSPDILQWGVFTMQPAKDACLFAGVAHYATGTAVRYEDASVFTEAGVAYALKIGTAWLKFGSFQGAQRIWHMMLLGTLGTSCTVTGSTYYDYVETARDTTTKLFPGSSAGGPAVFQTRQALSKQVCEAFRCVWTFTPTPQSEADAGTIVLNGVTVEVGVKPGRWKMAATNNF